MIDAHPKPLDDYVAAMSLRFADYLAREKEKTDERLAVLGQLHAETTAYLAEIERMIETDAAAWSPTSPRQ